jgi:hypothetical protein
VGGVVSRAPAVVDSERGSVGVATRRRMPRSGRVSRKTDWGDPEVGAAVWGWEPTTRVPHRSPGSR